MENELLKIKDEALEKIEACTSLKELNDIRVLYLGKKGPIQEAMKSMKNMDPDQRKTFGQTSNKVKQELSKAVEDKKEVLDTHMERVKKAYPAYFDTYNEMDTLIAYINKIDNLYCVGRNGQHRYNNIDHSMVTSFETVKNILNGNKDKSNIWNVNTEQEYHEEKK